MLLIRIWIYTSVVDNKEKKFRQQDVLKFDFYVSVDEKTTNNVFQTFEILSFENVDKIGRIVSHALT